MKVSSKRVYTGEEHQFVGRGPIVQVSECQPQEAGSNVTKRHIRIKIPKHSAKVVNADEMRMLQVEAAAKIFHQRISALIQHQLDSNASTRKGSTNSSNSAEGLPHKSPSSSGD